MFHSNLLHNYFIYEVWMAMMKNSGHWPTLPTNALHLLKAPSIITFISYLPRHMVPIHGYLKLGAYL